MIIDIAQYIYIERELKSLMKNNFCSNDRVELSPVIKNINSTSPLKMDEFSILKKLSS